MEDDQPLLEMDLGLNQNVIREIDLIACSPLTRALQTTELSLVPHLQKNDYGCPKVPIVALPLASERVYLISDEGRSTDHLAKQFPCVDFESSIDNSKKDCWWFTYDDESGDPSSSGDPMARVNHMLARESQKPSSIFASTVSRP